jgi:quercetin dioxygenase-like cupin family protein
MGYSRVLPRGIELGAGNDRRGKEKSMRGRLLVLASVIGAAISGVALATPTSGTIVAETVRGDLGERLNVHTKFDNGASVHIKTKGAIEIITQRIEAAPGSSFGWHSHPGENVNVIKQGTLTLYHAKHCTEGIAYGPGTSFATHPEGVHLARNEGTETVVFFATYFAPRTDPLLPVRIDEPSPGPSCPQ